ncbi:MAG: transcription termination/antitermination protein NusG [Microbacteriaceae bacterium]
MTENHFEDIDLSTAAEQSSEEDEAQEGNTLSEDVAGATAAEELAMHEVADDETNLDEALDALADAVDPEADAVVEDALDIDSADEADAAADATADEETVTAAVSAEPEEDPYADFKKELRRKSGKWYVIHSYAGYEKKVKTNIENRVLSMNMQDSIFEVQVPLEDVVDIKNGQRKLVTRVRVPSYVLVRMELNEDSWSTVRHTPGVTGFVGNAHNPIPLSFDESFEMLKTTADVEGARAAGGIKTGSTRSAKVTTDYELGETVGIKEGAFAGLQGTINEIHAETGKLSILINVFGRDTAVEFTFAQVEKQ